MPRDGRRSTRDGGAAPATGRRRRLRRLAVGGALLAVGVCVAAAYLLVWGRYSPYGPIVYGFERHDLPGVVVYVERDDGPEAAHAGGGSTMGAVTGPDPAAVDGLVAEVQAAHTLRFKSRPRLLLFRDTETYARRTTTRARACTYYNGTIVVSPWVQEEAAEGVLSLEVYLKHELSHALLYQHMGVRAALRYPKWLLEGVATWSAGQMGTFAYPSAEETYALIAAGDWMPPDVYRTSGEDAVPLEADDRMTFVYCEFACIVDDLVARYGRETFFVYVTALMDDGDHDAVFRAAFGVGFDAYLDDFRARVEATADVGALPPPAPWPPAATADGAVRPGDTLEVGTRPGGAWASPTALWRAA